MPTIRPNLVLILAQENGSILVNDQETNPFTFAEKQLHGYGIVDERTVESYGFEPKPEVLDRIEQEIWQHAKQLEGEGKDIPDDHPSYDTLDYRSNYCRNKRAGNSGYLFLLHDDDLKRLARRGIRYNVVDPDYRNRR